MVQQRLAAILLIALTADAQFKTSVPLVVAPLTVTDAQGRPVDGLTADYLRVLDNGIPQAFELTTLGEPLSVVVAIQENLVSQPMLDKVRDIGTILSDAVAGEGGKVALLGFAAHAKLLQGFTDDSSKLTYALHHLHLEEHGFAPVETAGEAVRMLSAEEGKSRRVIVMLSQGKEMVSGKSVEEVKHLAQAANVEIYWLDFSAFLAPFTTKRKTVWDRMSDEEKADHKFPSGHELDITPPDSDGGSLIGGLMKLAERDVAGPLTSATGGRKFTFATKAKLEAMLQEAAADMHRKYFVTFQPKGVDTPGFHTLRIEVKGRSGLRVRTRSGYWSGS